MTPFNGVSLCRDSQDFYYSFKMAEAYFDKIVKNNQYPKFCLIGLAPYGFNNWLDKTIRNFDQQFYFPIIGHEQMEYHGSKHGKFLETIFKSKYKSWLNYFIDDFLNSPNKERFTLNDIDWSREWHQKHYALTNAQHLNVADELSIYGHKFYPETIKRNKEILNKYIKLCRERNVIPIGVVMPFTQMAQRHYPQKALKEFFTMLKPFLNEMELINLWDTKLPDSYFEDTTHLKMTGAVEVSKMIKELVLKILSK